MKVTLLEDFGSKKKGDSFEVSSPTAINLIKKGVAVKFGETTKSKSKEKEAKTEK
jgi:ribosomal protein L9